MDNTHKKPEMWSIYIFVAVNFNKSETCWCPNNNIVMILETYNYVAFPNVLMVQTT